MDSTERILVSLGDIKEDLGGLRADVKHVLDQQAEQEKRLTSLEKSRSHVGGIVAGVSFVTTLVVSAGAYALQFFPLR